MASVQELSKLYERVTNSPFSSFYRSLYGKIDTPLTAHEWESLPLLTKADIARVPFDERIFIPSDDVDLVRLTSGTTASGVLAVPRARMSYTDAEQRLMPADSYMGFLLPHRVYDNYTQPGAKFIGGDPARLPESAKLAAHMSVGALGGLPSTLIAFASYLCDVYDIHKIRHLCLNGEVCTAMQRHMLRKLYPGVQTMVSSYGSSETQGLCGISIHHPGREDALLGHPLVHYELVDENGAVLHGPTAEGELVVSILYEGAAFPLLRYRTGDRAVALKSEPDFIFTIEGRATADRIRFESGMFILAEMERAIGAAGKGYVADFEASVTESVSGHRIQTGLEIALIVPPLFRQTIPADIGLQIAREMRVNERRTYADAVAQGSCSPLRCRVEGLEWGTGRKRQRLTDLRNT